MNIELIKEYIVATQNQADKHREKANLLEQEILGLKKALELLGINKSDVVANINNKETKSGSSKANRQKISCRGHVRDIYKIMKKANRPISPKEIQEISNNTINPNTISGTLSIAYNKKGFIDKISDGLYQINAKGLKLLEDTKDDDVKRDI